MRWMPAGNAMEQWKGRMGEDARAAALKREVTYLSPEAKRTLLAVAYLRECAYSELSQVTGYSDVVLGDCIIELKSLYLISAPKITEEARFRVTANTERYVLRTKDALATDFSRLEQRVRELRSQAKGLKVKLDNPVVGAAIYQAIAHLKQGSVQAATETIEAAERKVPNHPDLLIMRARCLLELEQPKPTEARALTRKAYEYGSRKDVLFDIWYEGEWAAAHYMGAVEVAELRLNQEEEPEAEWLVRRAAALWRVAQDQWRAGNRDRALADFGACDEDLQKAYEIASIDDKNNVLRRRFELHDLMWGLLRRLDPGVDSARRVVDEMRRMVKGGDFRLVTYVRLREALEDLIGLLDRDSRPISVGFRNLVEQRIREVDEDFGQMLSKRREDSRRQEIFGQLQATKERYAAIVQRRGFASA
jgi:hypothetical protein